MERTKAEQLSERARVSSKLANLWLEHPYVAHVTHEAAASAWEQLGDQKLAEEHRRSAQYWAKKEARENSRHYINHN